MVIREDRVPRGSGLLHCWIEHYDSAVVIYARGELDLSSAPALRRCLERAEASGRSMIVDLRSITYLDGHGFRVLEEAVQRARDQRRTIRFIPSRAVQRLVTLLRFDDVVPLSGSLEDAVDHLPPNGAVPPRTPPSG